VQENGFVKLLPKIGYFAQVECLQNPQHARCLSTPVLHRNNAKLKPAFGPHKHLHREALSVEAQTVSLKGDGNSSQLDRWQIE
jgi:hypothetical protein